MILTAGRFFRIALVVALAGPAHAAPTRCDAGPPESAGAAQVWRGDFDGDGGVDRVWMLPPSGQPAGRLLVADPWRNRLRHFDPAALTLVLAKGASKVESPRCILFQNRSFFATPIWDEADKPLRLLLRSDPAAKDWQRVTRRWRGDGILLGTEAGADVLLYWDGRRWRIAMAREAP